jgi:cytochrome c oxidase subunit 3
MAFDAREWVVQGVDPRPVQLFLMFYYIMTGLHAVHLTVGIALIGIQAVLAWRGRFSPENYMPVELAGLYWHFVDVIWIFLLPLLYLVGTRG